MGRSTLKTKKKKKENRADWSNTVIILPVSPWNLEVVVEENK